MVFAFFRHLVDDDANLFPNHRFGVFRVDFFLKVGHGVEPCARLALVYRGQVHLHHGRPLFGAEHESTQVVELDVFQQFHQFLEVLVRLAGEPDKYGRAERDSRNALANLVQNIDELLLAVVALHVLEYVVAGVLNRHVHVLHEARFVRHQVQQFVVHEHRVPVQRAYPRDVRVVENRAEQAGQSAALLALLAPEVCCVLRDEGNLLHALFFKFLGFCHNVFDASRHLLATYQRDRAVGATAVAPFGNLQVGVVLEPAEVHAREVLGIATLRGYDSHLLQEFARLVRAYPVVYLGQFLHKLLAVAAREATRYNQFLLGFLAVNLCENRVDGFFFRGLDEPACVHQDVVRLGSAVAGGKACVQHLADEVLRVDLVLGAS